MVLPPPSPIPEPLRPSSDLLAAWLLVLVEGGVAHGYDMRRELAARRLEVDYASVYRMLRKLQRDGQLRSHWGTTVAGPRRRLYEITPAGLRNLAEIAERLAAISRTHDTFFEAYAQTAGQLLESAPSPYEPTTPPSGIELLGLDHLALSVDDPGALASFLCDHVGMRELGLDGGSVIVGPDGGGAKLSLFAADGPREPAALHRVILRVADLQRALASLPAGADIQQQGPHGIAFAGPGGLGLGFTPMAGSEIDYDVAHVILRVADPAETGTALAELGCVPRGETLHVGDTRITLEELPAWSDRPLLDHIAVHARSVQAVAAQARRRGRELDGHAADGAVTVVLPGAERIRMEFVELATYG